jgi:hypothetical protein
MNASVLNNDHLMYQEVQPGLNLWPDEDTLQEEQIDGFHLYLFYIKSL